MTEELKNAYESYVTASAEKKRLEKKIAEARAVIMKQHMASETNLLCEGGFKSEIVHATTRKLVPARIEEKFGIKITDDCYAVDGYDRLTVNKLVVEG